MQHTKLNRLIPELWNKGGQLRLHTSKRFFWLFAGFGFTVVAQLIALIMLLQSQEKLTSPLLLMSFLASLGVMLVFAFIATFHHDLISPSERLSQWSAKVRAGDHSVRLPLDQMGALRQSSIDINTVMDHLESISKDMQSEVKRQTAKFEQKTKSLQLLYDVATSINTSRDLNDLLSRFLHTMRYMMQAKAGMVRMTKDGGTMELVSSFGLDKETIQKEKSVSVHQCMCGQVINSGELRTQNSLLPCSKALGIPHSLQDQSLQMIAVPLQHHDKTVGVYNLFIDPTETVEPDSEMSTLLSSVGQHLGMAIEKARLDDESKRLSIMKERNALAHELHDSLAQTLASLRFQVSMLDESINDNSLDEIHNEIQQIKGGLDEAYAELRELLAHFRAPMHRRGLMPAIEDLINNFRKQTQMRVLLQREWDASKLAANMELQILRIIQESLTNIRKHSQAHTVRVLMRCTNKHAYTILIEDDGVGMELPAFRGHPGEHLGLSIMQERARYLGGELKIESEAGEGTRVQLSFTAEDFNRIQKNQHFALI